MDFFGELTEALDSIIPESSDIINVFDEASDFLLGDAESRKSRSAGATQQQTAASNTLAPITASDMDDFDAIAIGKGIAKQSQKNQPLESVDPRRIQAEWMQRLKMFALDKEQA